MWHFVLDDNNAMLLDPDSFAAVEIRGNLIEFSYKYCDKKSIATFTNSENAKRVYDEFVKNRRITFTGKVE